MTYASHYASKKRSQQRSRALADQGTGAIIQDRIDHLIARTGSLSEAWPEIGKVFAQRQDEVFATNSFGRWAPLRARTVILKREEGFSTDTLVRSGLLKRELTSAIPRSQGDFFVVLGPSHESDIGYVKFHLKGNGVPQRNPVPRLRPVERTNMLKKLRDYIQGDES